MYFVETETGEKVATATAYYELKIFPRPAGFTGWRSAGSTRAEDWPDR